LTSEGWPLTFGRLAGCWRNWPGCPSCLITPRHCPRRQHRSCSYPLQRERVYRALP
jgi:hypothetical protein